MTNIMEQVWTITLGIRKYLALQYSDELILEKIMFRMNIINDYS